LKSIFWTNQFKKDYKRAQKQRKDIKALKEVLVLLADGQKLPPRYKDHSLQKGIGVIIGIVMSSRIGFLFTKLTATRSFLREWDRTPNYSNRILPDFPPLKSQISYPVYPVNPV
jgi:hypothetical protein